MYVQQLGTGVENESRKINGVETVDGGSSIGSLPGRKKKRNQKSGISIRANLTTDRQTTDRQTSDRQGHNMR